MNGNISSFETAVKSAFYAFNYLNYSEHILQPDIPAIVTCDFNAIEKILCRGT